MSRGEIFNKVKVTAPQYNMFDLSHDVKMTGNMGDLMPIMSMECIPGDKVKLSADSLIRLGPMLASQDINPNDPAWMRMLVEFLIGDDTTVVGKMKKSGRKKGMKAAMKFPSVMGGMMRYWNR